mgnify:CR=1 FL=1
MKPNKVTNSSGAIIVASTGVFSTGINIKNLHQIVFASPTKSQIKVLQEILREKRNVIFIKNFNNAYAWKNEIQKIKF